MLQLWLQIGDGLEDAIASNAYGIHMLIIGTLLICAVHPKVFPTTYTLEESICAVGFFTGFVAGFLYADETGVMMRDPAIYEQAQWFRAIIRLLVGYPVLLGGKEIISMLSKRFVKIFEGEAKSPLSPSSSKAALKKSDSGLLKKSGSGSNLKKRSKSSEKQEVQEEKVVAEKPQEKEAIPELSMLRAGARYFTYFVGYGLNTGYFIPLVFKVLGL